MANSLRQRLLADIAELQTQPYPNIELHFSDQDMTRACLILTADSYGPMHLSVELPSNYPLAAPSICMNSQVLHPNIFGSYICASILNNEKGYTSAYTLKSIAIQLLSFFSSSSIMQSGGQYSVNLEEYRQRHRHRLGPNQEYRCLACRFGYDSPPSAVHSHANITALNSTNSTNSTNGQSSDFRPPYQIPTNGKWRTPIQESNLASEILLDICAHLDTEDLMHFAESWTRIGSLITGYDIIRTRELQCFCFKKDYKEVKLGVGVAVPQAGHHTQFRKPTYSSEFDLLSQEAYGAHIRRSTQGVQFSHWLPLPISHGHWRKVEKDAYISLAGLAISGGHNDTDRVKVLCDFMNNIVVRLNDAGTSFGTSEDDDYVYGYGDDETVKSTLTHASEKAIESYFHIYHLLLCLATTDNSVVQYANMIMRDFLAGNTSKKDISNLGHLLVFSLISEVQLTEQNMNTIIREAITRNVYWTLDKAGAGMAELAYFEKNPGSRYRLQKTFAASIVSYRLLMFLNLFRKTALGRPDKDGKRKSLTQLRDEAFQRHGAPPRGSAKMLANSIKRIHQVDNFRDFLTEMSMSEHPEQAYPGDVRWTNLLQQCIRDSMSKGYTTWYLSQPQALTLRRLKEPSIDQGSPTEWMSFDRIPKRAWYPGQLNRVGRGGKGGGRGGLGGVARGRR